jgi:hypothetical protein
MVMHDKRYKILRGNRENLPWIGSVDSSYSSYLGKEDLPWACEIWIKLANSNDKGLPSENEFTHLENIEEGLFAKISQATPSFQVGKISWNSKRYILIYLAEPATASNLLNSLIQKEEYQYDFEFNISKDPAWQIAKNNFIYE